MFVSTKYVLKENFDNVYRIYSISKYELLADMKDSKLGIFWNFATPIIRILTYWFAFGFIYQRKAVHGIPYLVWLVGGMVVWFFVSPCITEGSNAIYRKSNVITKMKFPVSILPMTVIMKEFFNHLCLMVIVVITFALFGYYPTVHWLGLIYYMICAIMFTFSLSLATSVLNMLARDTRKFILSIMRLLMYLTPIIWELDRLGDSLLTKIISCNPIYYIVNGYRDCFFYHQGLGANMWGFGWFWAITIALFFFGSYMMYKFKTRFIDLI